MNADNETSRHLDLLFSVAAVHVIVNDYALSANTETTCALIVQTMVGYTVACAVDESMTLSK